MLRRIIVVVAVVAGCSAATPPSADMVGIRVAIGNKGIAQAEHIAIPYAVKALQDIQIGDLSLSEDHFAFDIKSIECKNLKVGAVDISLSSTAANANANIGGLTLDCTASWHYELDVWPHVPYGSGSVTMTVGGGVATVVTPYAVAPENYTQVTLNTVTPSISVTSIDFSGGITADILDLFKDHIKSFVSGEISSQISGLLKKEMTSTVNPLLAKMPISLLACSVLPGAGPSAVCELSPKPALPDNPAVSVPALPIPDAATMANHDLAVLVDATPLNLLLDWLYSEEQLFMYTLTPAAVPSSLPIKLTTDSFQGIAPGMAAKYPGMALQVALNATARPDVAIGAGVLNLTLPLELIWSVCNSTVRDCNAIFDGPGLTEAFRITAPVRAGISASAAPAAGGNNTLLTGNMPYLEIEWALKSTQVGNVSIADLQGLTSLVVSGEALPAVNKILNKGVSIPTTIGPVAVSDLSLAMFAPAGATPFISVAANVNYTPPSEVAALDMEARVNRGTADVKDVAARLMASAMRTPLRAVAARMALEFARRVAA